MRLRSRQSADHFAAGPLVLAAILALGILFFGAYITNASWTTAILTNSQNTSQATGAVALRESASGTTCQDTAATPGNTAVCTTINKYGGTGTPLPPSDFSVTTVTLTNTGTIAGNLSLIPSGCTATGGSASSTTSLCGWSFVRVSCDQGALGFFTPSTPSTVNIGRLEPGASVDCDVTFQVLFNAPASVSGQTVSQPLMWRITAV